MLHTWGWNEKTSRWWIFGSRFDAEYSFQTYVTFAAERSGLSHVTFNNRRQDRVLFGPHPWNLRCTRAEVWAGPIYFSRLDISLFWAVQTWGKVIFHMTTCNARYRCIVFQINLLLFILINMNFRGILLHCMNYAQATYNIVQAELQTEQLNKLGI
jgi:hypothetical protein